MADYLGYDEQTWEEAAAVLDTPLHDYEDHAERARALDDRHPDKLAVIAADLEREARPAVEDLMAERYGRRVGGR